MIGTPRDDLEPWIDRPAERVLDDVGEVIREYRLAARRSQSEIAAAMGVTQQLLSQIEKGTRRASLEHRRRSAQVLGIPPGDLGLADGARTAPGSDDPEVAASRGRWRAQRHWLNQHRSELAKRAAGLYPHAHRLAGTPLIAHPDWIPDTPVNLSSIGLNLDERRHGVVVTGREPSSLPTRPLRTSNQPFESYTAAIRQLDPPRLFESRPSYRYLGGSIAGRELQFGLGAYFDKLDISEALAHEMAIACAGGLPSTMTHLQDKLPLRASIIDPFDPLCRAILPAIGTLTIRLRRWPDEPSFLLHWRDPGKVATAAGMYGIIPAGEFQPSTVAPWDRVNDFSLWRNIVREYSEELLGTPEHDGTRTEPIDYPGWSLYQELSAARERGTLTVSALGMGLDALTLAAAILTVVVIDDDTFKRAFSGTVRFNDEGEIVAIAGGRVADGIPFTEETVERMLSKEPLVTGAAAALALAWRHRKALI